MTDPVKFQLNDRQLANQTGAASTTLGVFAGMLAIGLAVAAVFFYRHRKSLKALHNGGVAFENPSYMREINMDNNQVA